MPLNHPILVRTLGHIERNPRHSTPGTKDGDIMMTLVESGYGWYRNRQGTTHVKPGMVGLVTPEDPGALMADKKAPYNHHYTRFSGEYARELTQHILAQRGAAFFEVDNITTLTNFIRPFPRSIRRSLPNHMGHIEVGVLQILLALQGTQPERHHRGLDATRLYQYFDLHLDTPTDIEAMAHHFSMTKTSLCRAAKRLLGTTIVKAHESLRIDWSKELLRSGMLTVAEVAERVGYDDPHYFSRVFKRHLGLSPKQWQTTIRQEESD